MTLTENLRLNPNPWTSIWSMPYLIPSDLVPGVQPHETRLVAIKLIEQLLIRYIEIVMSESLIQLLGPCDCVQYAGCVLVYVGRDLYE